MIAFWVDVDLAFNDPVQIIIYPRLYDLGHEDQSYTSS